MILMEMICALIINTLSNCKKRYTLVATHITHTELQRVSVGVATFVVTWWSVVKQKAADSLRISGLGWCHQHHF